MDIIAVDCIWVYTMHMFVHVFKEEAEKKTTKTKIKAMKKTFQIQNKCWQMQTYRYALHILAGLKTFIFANIIAHSQLIPLHTKASESTKTTTTESKIKQKNVREVSHLCYCLCCCYCICKLHLFVVFQ